MLINIIYGYFGEQVLSIVGSTQMSEHIIGIVVCIMSENGLFIIMAIDNIDDDRLCHRCILLPQLSDCKLEHADSDKLCHRCGMSGHVDSDKVCHRCGMSGHADSDKVCHRCVVLPQLSDCKLNHADSDKVRHRRVVLPQFSDCKLDHADSNKLCHRYVWSC